METESIKFLNVNLK